MANEAAAVTPVKTTAEDAKPTKPSPTARTAAKQTGGSSKAGPPSSLKTGTATGGVDNPSTKSLAYSVQIHTDEKGLEVLEPINAESGDEAAQIALAKKNYRGASVRGVTPYSDPDANSLGGEREAGIMFGNAENSGAIINTLGTDANREATEKLGKADVTELGE